MQKVFTYKILNHLYKQIPIYSIYFEQVLILKGGGGNVSRETFAASPEFKTNTNTVINMIYYGAFDIYVGSEQLYHSSDQNTFEFS